MKKPVTAGSLIRALGVIDEDILGEAARMAVLSGKAARYRVQAMRERSQAEAKLEAWDARLSLRLRARARSRSDKPTEAYYKAKIVLNPKHRRLARDREEALFKEELAKLIMDAFRTRRDGIRIIADHRGYEGAREESMVERRDQMRRMSASVRELERRRRRVEG